MTQPQSRDGQEGRQLAAEDLFRLHLIRQAALSPDGSRICFVRQEMSPEENEYRSHLFMLPAEGGEPEPFTTGAHRDFAPAWSPDGRRIAFLSTRSGSTQLWIIPADGGEARQVTSVEGIGGSPIWSPDGRQIALSITIDDIGLETVAEAEQRRRQRPRERYTGDVRRIDALPYKLNGVGLLGDKFLQVAVVAAEPDSEPELLTRSRMDHTDPAWSPDGRWLAFGMTTTQMERAPDPRRLLIGDIGIIPVEGGEVRRLTRSLGPAYSPAFSPDGGSVAYLGHALEYGTYTQPTLWTVGVDGGEVRRVAPGFDRPFGDRSIGDLMSHENGDLRPVWSPDGRYIYCLVSDSGMVHLVRVAAAEAGAAAGSGVEPLTAGRRVICQFSMDSAAERAVLCQSDPLTPSDLVLLTLERAEERRLTRINQALLEGVELSAPERFTFRSGDVTVEGWMIHPSKDAARRERGLSPAVLEVHGGPMIMYGYRFFFEFQLLAANGFAVVYTNPRGSMGYGQQLAAAIRGDWGNLDYQDLINGIEAAIARGGIDPERVGIAGGSYGGYMVNWALGQSDRFRTGIAMRSISNLYSFFGTSDTGFTAALEWDGPPWEKPERYLRRSPISHVTGVKAPLLLIHSVQDLRTPLGQAEQFYTALKYLDREAVMLLYPGENHNLSRSGEPWHRVHRLEAIVEWMEEHLRR